MKLRGIIVNRVEFSKTGVLAHKTTTHRTLSGLQGVKGVRMVGLMSEPKPNN